jgi:FAD/FMN-containing dehydrogenase
MELFERGEGDYESLRRAAVWNGVVPGRYPDAIARPATRADVVRLIRDARRQGRRVAIRSGGHNWRAAYLRDAGLLIDMRNLNRVEVDPQARVARAEPGATHKLLADATVPHGLGFPIGHCPTVALGGYLLAGGYGWNPRSWGPAVWSVRALDVVTLDGEELFIDQNNHPDLYWAARGGSSGFPCVVTRYHLDLHPLPRMQTLRSAYPLARLPELLLWSSGQRERPAGVEVSVLVVRRPAEPDRPVTVLQTTTFGASDDEAAELMSSVAADLPFRSEIVDPGEPYAVALNTIEAAGAWIEGLRYSVDMCWINDGYEDIGRRTVELFEGAPSPLSRVIFAWHLFPDNAPDVAQTCNGDVTVNVYSIWGQGNTAADAENERWTLDLMAACGPWVTGFYAGEADLSVSPDRARRAYSPDNWERLERIRQRYDPDNAKFGYISEA